jgi:hypothetical protein
MLVYCNHVLEEMMGHTVRAVKVNRICTIGMIDEANDGLTPLLHMEGRSRDYTIVTDMACFDTRIDLDIDRLDLDFVVINVLIRPECGQKVSSKEEMVGYLLT